MPEEHFKTAFKQLNGDMAMVARRFDVSVPAAKVRAEYLGLNT